MSGHIFAIEFKGEMMSYNEYLDIDNRPFNLDRRICVIMSRQFWGMISIEEQNQIIRHLHYAMKGVASWPDYVDDYHWVTLGTFEYEFGYEPNLLDIYLGHNP